MKKDITERKLKAIGFEKQIETDEKNPYYYFTKELFDGECLMTNANDDAKKDGYYVQFFNMPTAGKFYEMKIIKNLIKLIESGIK